MSANIDQGSMPTDPEELLRMFNDFEGGEAASPKDEPAASLTAEDNPETNDSAQAVNNEEKDQGQQDNTSEQEPEGVATKDGKHIIPFSVLKGERDRAARAEQLANEANQRIAELEEKLKAGTPQAKTGESADTNDSIQGIDNLSDEELETLKEDFPTVYKGVMMALSVSKDVASKLKPVEESVRGDQEARQRSAADEVQEAIDSVPKLAHIQANNPELYELAKQHDAILRGQSQWQDKPMSERFKKVVELVEASTGQTVDLPETHKTNSMSAAELAKAARNKAAAEAAANKSIVPTSLSEFPAGRHAASDEHSAATEMNHLQLAEKMAGMTQAQMDAYFDSL